MAAEGIDHGADGHFWLPGGRVGCSRSSDDRGAGDMEDRSDENTERPRPSVFATQAMVLGGLVLLMGTTGFRGFWLWVIVGVGGVVIACLLLGSSAHARETLIHAMEQWPLWLYRVSGGMIVTLAVLFGADVILHGL